MADHPSTAPLSRAALLRVSEATGQLQSQQFVITVTSGPDVGKVLVLDGVAVVGTSPDNALVLTDPTISRQHLEIRVSGSGVRVKDLGSKNGTFMGGARIEQLVIEEKATLTLGQTVLHVALRQESLGDTRSSRVSFGGAVGQSPAMRQLFGLLERIAPRDVSVLLTGETGTGKEVLARAIHTESPRRGQPFIVVDCGSIPTELIQSELFGHVK
ncbi:MAG: sigma 54-interacting transcriptional regulator, partial [Myxococcaceae bacterium]